MTGSRERRSTSGGTARRARGEEIALLRHRVERSSAPRGGRAVDCGRDGRAARLRRHARLAAARADLVRRWRSRRTPELLAWAAALAAFAAGVGGARLGRRGGLGRPRVPRLLPLRRAAHGAAPRRRLASARPASRWVRPLALVYVGLASASRSRCRSTRRSAGLDPRGAGATSRSSRRASLAIAANSLGTRRGGRRGVDGHPAAPARQRADPRRARRRRARQRPRRARRRRSGVFTVVAATCSTAASSLPTRALSSSASVAQARRRVSRGARGRAASGRRDVAARGARSSRSRARSTAGSRTRPPASPGRREADYPRESTQRPPTV